MQPTSGRGVLTVNPDRCISAQTNDAAEAGARGDGSDVRINADVQRDSCFSGHVEVSAGLCCWQ